MTSPTPDQSPQASTGKPSMTAREAAEAIYARVNDSAIREVLDDPFWCGRVVGTLHPEKAGKIIGVLRQHHAARAALYREAVELHRRWMAEQNRSGSGSGTGYQYDVRELLDEIEKFERIK